MAPPRAPAFTGSALRGIVGGRFRLPALARSSEAGEGAAAAARAGCGAALMKDGGRQEAGCRAVSH